MDPRTPSLLPFPARVDWVEDFIGTEESFDLFQRVHSETRWQEREIMMFGRKIMQPRLVAWQGDPGKSYRYSGVTWDPDPWGAAVAEIRDRLTTKLGIRFNSVLLNLYRNGHDCMGWHRDDEPELGSEPCIASVSLGAVRKFRFRKMGDPRQKAEVALGSGSLLVMAGRTQELWQHALPRMLRVKEPRINLTFRVIR
jgi:alkylated DNA repair dioxygenase AlkB